MAEKKGERGGKWSTSGAVAREKGGRGEGGRTIFLPRTHLLPAFFAGGVRRRWYTHYGRKVRKQKTRARREFLASFPPPARWT